MDEKQFEIMVGKLNEIIASLQKLQKDTHQVSSNQYTAGDAYDDRKRAERKARRDKNPLDGW